MTTAIVGRVGSGKTYTAKFIATKPLIEGRRVCIIDPTDAWWGLRLQSDGESPSGLNVWIFGGDHADIPITPEHGARLGELVATGTVPQSIVSLADFTGAEMTRFLTDFLEEVYRRNRGAIELVVDEADAICPQNPMPEQRRMSGALDKIVRRGRIKGFRPMLITQRPAVLHKNVLSQASTLIAMRLTSPHDRKAIEEWVKGNADVGDAKRVLDSLAALNVGEGWDWSPAAGILERRQFPRISTYDSSRAPEHDEDIRDVKPLASAEIARIREIFAPAREAAKSAADPRDAEINRLREAAKGAAVVANTFKAEVEAAEARGYDRGLQHGIESANRSSASLFRQAMDQLRAPAQALVEQIESAFSTATADLPAPPLPKSLDSRPTAAEPPVFRSPRSEHKPAGDAGAPTGGLSRPQQKVIDSLTLWNSIGHKQPSREMIAVVAGYSPTSGGFNNLIGQLRTAGRVEIPAPGLVSLANGTVGRSMTAGEARDAMLSVLSAPQRKLVAAFRGDASMTREHLAALTEYSPTSGGFNNLIGALCTLGVMTKPMPGFVALSDWAAELLA